MQSWDVQRQHLQAWMRLNRVTTYRLAVISKIWPTTIYRALSGFHSDPRHETIYRITQAAQSLGFNPAADYLNQTVLPNQSI